MHLSGNVFTEPPGNTTAMTIDADDEKEKQFLLAWQDDRDGNPEIYYGMVDNGSKIGPDTRISDLGNDSQLPSVAILPDGKGHFVWQDHRDGNWEIYFATTVEGASDVGIISGVVTDAETNQPIAGAEISLSGGHIDKAIADSTGSYQILDVPAGEGYSVKASATGYRSVEVTGVFVAVGETTTVDFALENVYGTTVIIHGYNPNATDLTKDANWTLSMAQAIAQRVGRGEVYTVNLGKIDGPVNDYSVSVGSRGEKIIVFNWLEESDIGVFGYSEAAADALTSALIQGVIEGKWKLEQLHFIGHSRGTVVSSETIQRLGFLANNPSLLPATITIEHNIHFTLLDPHPWDDDWFDGVADLLSAGDNRVNGKMHKGIVCWENVAFADNYWQKGFFLSHICSLNIFNLNGMDSIPGANYSKKLADLNEMDHSAIHAWYHGTIDLLAEYDLDPNDDCAIKIEEDWYGENNEDRAADGFNRSLVLNGDMTIFKTSGTIALSSDHTFINWRIFNGNFDKTSLKGAAPGWEYQGGLGTGEIESIYSFNSYLKLEGVSSFRKHNRFYIPANAGKIYYRKQVLKSSEDDLFVVLIDEKIVYSHDVRRRMSYECQEIDAMPYQGGLHTIEFGLINRNGDDDNATVMIDDVDFVCQSEIRAIVASPVELHMYDSQGNHTGPTSDSTWVEDIPGSVYIPEGDSVQPGHQMITLPNPPAGVYTFKVISKDTIGFFSFQIEDITDKKSTISAFFDSIAIQRNTVATYTMRLPLTNDNLLVDYNGDGIADTSFAPSRFFQNFYIIATAGTNGAIDPPDTNIIIYGDSLIFSITPDPGYRITDVFVDGRSIGAVGNYAFRDVRGDHTIHAEFSSATGVTDKKAIPSEFIIYQNYPNPFNPSTTISFAVPKDGVVSLIIYDASGKEVKTLVNGFKQAGVHSVRFETQGLPSGVYFAKLTSGKSTRVRKLLLMK